MPSRERGEGLHVLSGQSLSGGSTAMRILKPVIVVLLVLAITLYASGSFAQSRAESLDLTMELLPEGARSAEPITRRIELPPRDAVVRDRGAENGESDRGGAASEAPGRAGEAARPERPAGPTERPERGERPERLGPPERPELPASAERAERGRETADRARERGRELGRQMSEEARENRENAGRGAPERPPGRPERPNE